MKMELTSVYKSNAIKHVILIKNFKFFPAEVDTFKPHCSLPAHSGPGFVDVLDQGSVADLHHLVE